MVKFVMMNSTIDLKETIPLCLFKVVFLNDYTRENNLSGSQF